jgi:GMP synthase-like glutamine amidotransferase
MKPIVIFRHSPTEGPGYFATHLEHRRLEWRLLKVDEGAIVPADPRGYAGLVFMGGPMSVNDDLPWIGPELALIRRAVDEDIPVLGHCLGGQLMSRALGGRVGRNPVREIGWGEVAVAQDEDARAWFGGSEAFLSFHWHGETFTIPPGARCIASSPWCAHQAFSLGKHLGMQCHVEMTEPLVRSWCRDWQREVASLAHRTPSVQAPDEMLADLDARLPALHRIAAVVYDRWIGGLAA